MELLLKSGTDQPFTTATKAHVIAFVYAKFAYGDFLADIHPDVVTFIKESLTSKETTP